MVRKLLPIFQALTPLLLIYGLVQAIGNIAELGLTTSPLAMDASMLSDVRIIYMVGVLRCFGDMFHYWALAAVVLAATRYLEREAP